MGGNCILLISMVNKRKLQDFSTNKVHWGGMDSKKMLVKFSSLSNGLEFLEEIFIIKIKPLSIEW